MPDEREIRPSPDPSVGAGSPVVRASVPLRRSRPGAGVPPHGRSAGDESPSGAELFSQPSTPVSTSDRVATTDGPSTFARPFGAGPMTASSMLDPSPGEPDVNVSLLDGLGFDAVDEPSFANVGTDVGQARHTTKADSAQPEDWTPVNLRLRDCKTLSDALKATEEKRARGEIYFAFTRISPKQIMGVPCHGFLARWTNEFAEETVTEVFGGGEYLVDIEVVDLNAPARSDGLPPLKKLHELKHKAPGNPKLPGLEKEDMSTDPWLKTILSSAIRPAGQTDVSSVIAPVVQTISSITERAQQRDEARMQQQFESLQRANDAVIRAERERAEALRSGQGENAITSLVSKLMDTTLDQRRDVSETSSNRLLEQQRMHAESMAQLQRSYDDRVRLLTEGHEREKEAMRSEHRRNMDALEQRHALAIGSAREDSRRAIEDADRNHERELRSLKSEHERALAAQVAQLSGQIETIKVLQEAELRRLREDVTRSKDTEREERQRREKAEAELHVAKEAFMRATNLPFHEELARATRVCRMLGWKPPDEVEPEAPDENSIKATVSHVVKQMGAPVVMGLLANTGLLGGLAGGAPAAGTPAVPGTPPRPSLPAGAAQSQASRPAAPGTAAPAPQQNANGRRRPQRANPSAGPAPVQPQVAPHGPPPSNVVPIRRAETGTPRVLVEPFSEEANRRYAPAASSGPIESTPAPGVEVIPPQGAASVTPAQEGASVQQVQPQAETSAQVAPPAQPQGQPRQNPTAADLLANPAHWLKLEDGRDAYAGPMTAEILHSGAPEDVYVLDTEQGKQVVTNAQLKRSVNFQARFRANGNMPIPEDMMIIVAQQLTAYMRDDASPSELVRTQWAMVGQQLAAVRGWVDAENAALFLDMYMPDQGWDRARGQDWIATAWATVDEILDQANAQA